MVTANPKTKAKPSEPPDGGYGWVVVVSASVCFAFIIGLARVSGIVYVAIIDNYSVSRTKASTVFVVSRLFSFITTPIVTKLIGRFCYSTLISIGGLVMSLSLFLSAFTNQMWQFTLTYGVLLGIGVSFVMGSSMMVINVYFKKRRAMALGIFFSLGAAGGFIMPPAVNILLEIYHLNGLFLIYSALCLNICPCALMIRQPDWIRSQPVIRKSRRRNSSEMTENGSIVLNAKDETHQTFLPDDTKKEKPKPTQRPLLLRVLSSARRDLSIFKDPVFVIMLISRILTLIPLFNLIQFIPDFIEREMKLGISGGEVAFLLSMTSIGDVVARLVVGVFLDKVPWPTKYSYALLAIITGVDVMLFQIAVNYTLLATFTVIFGLALGFSIVLQYVLEVELMGLERAPLAHGITQATSGTISVMLLIVVGYLRDVTGSYQIGMTIMGAAGILGGLVWLLEPCLVWIMPPRIVSQPSLEKFPIGCVENAV